MRNVPQKKKKRRYPIVFHFTSHMKDVGQFLSANDVEDVMWALTTEQLLLELDVPSGKAGSVIDLSSTTYSLSFRTGEC